MGESGWLAMFSGLRTEGRDQRKEQARSEHLAVHRTARVYTDGRARYRRAQTSYQNACVLHPGKIIRRLPNPRQD